MWTWGQFRPKKMSNMSTRFFGPPLQGSKVLHFLNFTHHQKKIHCRCNFQYFSMKQKRFERWIIYLSISRKLFAYLEQVSWYRLKSWTFDMDFSNFHKDFLRYHSTRSETKKSGFIVQDKYVLVSWIQNFIPIGWKMTAATGFLQSELKYRILSNCIYNRQFIVNPSG
jgi:hypothetical protein